MPYLTPNELPEARRCLRLLIPADPLFIAAVNGALSELCKVFYWEQYGAVSPEDAAYAALEMLEAAWQEPNCYGEIVELYLRQNPDNPCILESSTDNATWTAFADLSLCNVPELRRNPATGQIETSTDGENWEPVPTGPWVETGAITYAETRPRPELTDDEKRCNAAANAALVLQTLYRQTYDRVTQGIANLALDIGQMLVNGLSNLIGINIPSWLAIENGQTLMNESDHFTNGGFPDTDLETVRCILYDNSTANPDGTVTFDATAVKAAFGAEYGASGDPFGGLNVLLTILGDGALNVAGAVQAISDADCTCEEGPSGTCRLGGNGTANLFTEFTWYDAQNDYYVGDQRPEGWFHIRTTFSLNAQTYWKRVYISADWTNIAPHVDNAIRVKAQAWNGAVLWSMPIEGTGSYEGWVDFEPNQYSVHVNMAGWAGGSWVGKNIRLKLLCFDPA